MLQQVRDGFFRVGWMLPVLVPAFGLLGRGLANTTFYLYLIWALLALRPRDWRVAPAVLATYVTLIVVCLVGIRSASVPAETMHFWFRWVTYTLVLPITLTVLSKQTLDLEKLERLLIAATFIALAVFAYRLIPVLLRGESVPIGSMALAYQFPFLLVFLLSWHLSRAVRWLSGLVVGAGFVGMFFAESSTEVLVAGVGILVFFALYSKFGKRILLGGLVLVPMVLAVELLPKWSLLRTTDWVKILDVWSSRRTTMWIRAFQEPPSDIWFGVGMGNAQFAWPVSSVGVKGFHNFIFDAWYETGILGISALLLLLWLLLWPAVRALYFASTEIKARCAPWLAGIVAILVAASLDHSYASVSFAMLMFFELSVLLALTGNVPQRFAQESGVGGRYQA